MKKKQFKQLSLKKSTISKLQNKITTNANRIVGGTDIICTIGLSYLLHCFEDNGTTDPNTQGCSMECTSGCNDTFTCRDHSCDCV
ncbi:hypothetical protein H2O64_21010 [Kordia sp. YSTF-M3]|uniref:Uncharacterized protein n=1 Tax=Kordia aestuariivivens TaxID=2759037 RepID=A0ABR7QFG8_9FLAO|nr:hypothetical protein [Kordia aestuariivivens]MBC8757163.1 hypothetical protein [Kordia aestuariivivens]